jgi:mxaA protein
MRPSPAALAIAMLCCRLMMSPAHADAPGMREPRAFGYFIGDTITREVELAAGAGYQLNPESLPKVGRASRWLALQEVAVRTEAASPGMLYRIAFRYQIINAPTQALVAIVPGTTFALSGPGAPLEQRLGDWPFLLSPLTGDDERSGLEAIRPSRSPRAIDLQPGVRQALLYGCAAVLLGGWLLWERMGPALRGRPRPFATAARELRVLSREPAGTERDHAAMRAVHRAFDAVAGQRVFPAQLDAWFGLHPEFLPAREQARQFFAVSQAEFFGHGAAGGLSIDDLLTLCAQLRSHEHLHATAA